MEPGQVPASLVLADPVGIAHEARVPGIQKVVDHDRSVPHPVVTPAALVARPTGEACRSFRMRGTVASMT
jgi:hypothetical protein